MLYLLEVQRRQCYNVTNLLNSRIMRLWTVQRVNRITFRHDVWLNVIRSLHWIGKGTGYEEIVQPYKEAGGGLERL